jgi:predicted DNA-binding transcriptional regulator AlpA
VAEERLYRRADIRLMGAGEIAERLGVVRQRVYQIANRKGFPDPIASLTMGQVWLADDVEDWIRENRPHLNEPDEA